MRLAARPCVPLSLLAVLAAILPAIANAPAFAGDRVVLEQSNDGSLYATDPDTLVGGRQIAPEGSQPSLAATGRAVLFTDAYNAYSYGESILLGDIEGSPPSILIEAATNAEGEPREAVNHPEVVRKLVEL